MRNLNDLRARFAPKSKAATPCDAFKPEAGKPTCGICLHPRLKHKDVQDALRAKRDAKRVRAEARASADREARRAKAARAERDAAEGATIALYARGQKKAFKGYSLRVFKDGTDAWGLISRWGAIHEFRDCADRNKLSHESRKTFASREAAVRAGREIIAAKVLAKGAPYTIHQATGDFGI
jgi:hypothetical protein